MTEATLFPTLALSRSGATGLAMRSQPWPIWPWRAPRQEFVSVGWGQGNGKRQAAWRPTNNEP